MRRAICPRRVLEFGPWKRDAEPLDKWLDRASFSGHDDMTPTCSHCGSLHPHVLMAGLRDGTLAIGGSDKHYKWYVDRPWSELEWARQKKTWLESHIGKTVASVTGSSEKAWEEYRQQSFLGRTQVAKFYTAHLSCAQCEEILAMWEAKTLQHSMYVQPWFPAMSEDAPAWLVEGADPL